ncbi:MAG: hypothetical protein MK106_03120 [Mariniblastus sp.]|nr:hypothetical protein [Mariniblastus sp.]
MEVLEIAIALVRRIDGDGIHWLLRDEDDAKYLNFIVAQRLEGELLRETLSREVAWRWELNRKRDFVVSSMAQLNVELDAQFPGQSEMCHWKVAFVNVDIYRPAALEQLGRDVNARWVDSATISKGTASDGRVLDPFVINLNKQYNVIKAWETNQLGWHECDPKS